jgi:uncharacterized surface protein with fasciclin (FAS1) repeats
MLGGTGLLAPAPARATLTPPPTVVDVLQRDGRFTTLLAALDAAGLRTALRGTGPFTVFAPTDAAFAALPPGTVEALLNDIPALTDILLYHVLGSAKYSYSLLQSSTAVTLEGNPILVLREGTKVRVNGRGVVSANLRAGNGIVHVLDGVLLPPAQDIDINSLVDVLALDGRFTTLLAAVEAAGLKSALQGPGPLTVFAPTDAAFAALPPGTVQALLNDIPTLQSILLYHVVGARLSSWQLLLRGQASTLQGDVVTAKLRWPSVFINDSRVLNPDVNAPNGVIHTVAKVLLPPAMSIQTIGQVLAADGRFTTLLAALQATGLDTALAGPGPFTVFAPTDDAFARLPAGTVPALLADLPTLRNILLYHVVAGDLNTAELAAQKTATTLQGATVRIYSALGRTYVNKSYIQDGNLKAMNGIIHAISAVLQPPTETK